MILPYPAQHHRKPLSDRRFIFGCKDVLEHRGDTTVST
jgi:hypothetical protein